MYIASTSLGLVQQIMHHLNVKINFSIEQAMKVQRWSRGIALFFL
jgi:hypothetical protein